MFIHDKVLDTNECDCKHRRRIDLRQLIGNTRLCIEVGENQHNTIQTSKLGIMTWLVSLPENGY